MALHIANTDNFTDRGVRELDGAIDVTTAVVAGTTYLFVAGNDDDGVSVFAVAADGTLTNVHNVTDDATLELDGARGVTTAVIAGITYLFVAGSVDDGVSVFLVTANGALTNMANVTDDATLELDGATGVTTAVIGGDTYLFVTGSVDSGVSVFSVAANGTLTNADNVTNDAVLELLGARGVTTAVVGGTTYLFIAASGDDGVSVFSVAADGELTNVDNVDESDAELNSPHDVTTAVIGGATYLFVGGTDAVTVFSVAANGTLSVVEDGSDPALEIDTSGVATAVIAGITYLFAASDGVNDEPLTAFVVAADGTLTLVTEVSDDARLELDDAAAVATAVVGGAAVLFAAGFSDDGVSVFSLVNENVSAVGDVLWRHLDGTVAIAAHELGGVPNNWEIPATGDFDGDGDGDILWRHVDGLVVTWELENGALVTNHNIAFASTGWEIVNTGDFDADHDADVLWRHRDGAVVTWEMENGEYVQNHNIAFASTGWEIQGLGDFDADGDSDIIWRHRDGAVVTWEMENGEYLVNHNIAFASTGWEIEGTGDFDADGDADILWRHRDGAVVTWEMENGEFLTNHSIAFASTGWEIEGTGDFNADGTGDILWRHAGGQVVTWEMDGGALLQTHNFGVVPNAWQIRGTGEFDLA